MWDEIRARYLAGESMSAISRSLGGKPSIATISRRAKEGHWKALRPGKKHPPEPVRKDSPEKREKILDLLQNGATFQLAARAVGVSINALEKWRETDRDFNRLCIEAVAGVPAAHLRVIHEAGLTGNVKASQWMTERHPETRDEFGPKESGAGAPQIVINIPRTEAEARELIDVTPQARQLEND